MSLADVLRFAWVALSGHRLRSSLSLLGVAIGVAAVILLTSLGQGALLYVTGEFALLGSNLLIILPGKVETAGMMPAFGGTTHDLTLDDIEAIRRRVGSVRQIAPLVVGTARARFGERSRDVTVAGTTSDWLHVRKLEIQTGRYIPAGDPSSIPRVCVIGPILKTELFPDRSPLGEMLRVGEERFRVIGLISPRGVSLGIDLDEVVQIPIVHAMRMLNRSSVFRVLAEASSPEAMPETKKAMLRVLVDRHEGEEDVTVITQDAVVAGLGKVLGILTAALAGIAAVSLSVAGVGIMNVMLVSVSERTREVGLLKALGVKRRQVLAVFLAEAALLSTGGGLAGLAAGATGARVLRAVYPSFPVQPPVWAVVAAVAVSIAVGLVFGVLPARRAAGLDPVAALARR